MTRALRSRKNVRAEMALTWTDTWNSLYDKSDTDDDLLTLQMASRWMENGVDENDDRDKMVFMMFQGDE